MLEVKALRAWYGRTQALFNVSFNLPQGRCLALVGTNGAGKTTIIRALLGLIKHDGDILLGSENVVHLPTYRRVRAHKISVVHEGRGLFARLTVRENIVVGLDRLRRAHLDDALDLFPMLRARLNEHVMALSGGQQQMVALARVVIQRPELLLLDEPALGLAPAIVDDIYGHLGKLRAQGLTMLVVEQSVPRASAFADDLCLIRTGRSAMTAHVSDTGAINQLVAAAFGNGTTEGPSIINTG
jgi:branched-chain amino acid transport system ATP-binding protein